MKLATVRQLCFFFALLGATVCASVARGQTPSYSSYSQYFNQQVQQPMPTYNYTNPRTFTADQYFLHNPAISPYLNLTRPVGGSGLPNYYRYTLPEENRRGMNMPSVGSPAMPPPFSAPGPAQAPVKSATPYYSHYFPTYGK
jgi:hypothetical protein